MKILAALAAASFLVGCQTRVPGVSCSEAADCRSGRCVDGVCTACTETELSCGNGVDDDCDGQVDCADQECAAQVCRGAMGACDVAESCTAGECPPNRFAETGALCREETACGFEERCDGASPACPAGRVKPGSAGLVCRHLGACARDAFCDGVAPDCPASVLEPAGSLCRGPTSERPCLAEARCDGADPRCPAEAFKAAGEKCRDPDRPCEAERTCTGTSGECPGAPAPAAAGLLCRPKAAECDVEERCDGLGLGCPYDAKVAAGTKCREAGGGCDPADVCDGASPSCPENRVRPAGSLCKPSSGPCSLGARCDGTSPACGPEAPAAAGTPCRSPAGACDKPEKCDGAAIVCPVDELLEARTQCRAAVGPCDAAEFCDGASAKCPANGYLAGVVCGAAGGCRVPGVCQGTGAECPPDALLSVGRCGLLASETCTGPGVCGYQQAGLSTPTGWTWENPLPQGNALYAAARFGTEYYLAGEAATLLRFNETSGFSRMPVAADMARPFTGSLRAMCVAGGKLWVAGDEGYAAASSSGSVWTELSSLTMPTFRGIAPVAGTVVGVGDLGAIERFDVNLGWVDDRDPALAGLTKTLRAIAPGSTLEAAVAVGDDGIVLRRLAAKSWQKTFCQPAVRLSGVTSVGTELWATAEDAGQSLFSIDRDTGACAPLPNAPKTALHAISAPVVGAGAIRWVVGDGGLAWRWGAAGGWSQAIPVGVDRTLFAVVAEADDLPLVAGASGAVARLIVDSSTGGRRWVTSPSATYSRLNALWGTDTVTYAVGDANTVLKRSGYGGWTAEHVASTGEPQDFLAISGTGPSDVWIAGGTADSAALQAFDGTSWTSKVPAGRITAIPGIAVNPSYVTLAGPTTVQITRATGASSNIGLASRMVVADPSSSTLWLADAKVYKFASNTAVLASVADGPYRALFGLWASGSAEYRLLALADGVTSGTSRAWDLGTTPGSWTTTVPCNAVWSPLGAAATAACDGGYVQPLQASAPATWIGTNLALRAVWGTSTNSGLRVAGEGGAILRGP